MRPSWFRDLTGFEELSYDETQRNLEVIGSTLRSKVNGQSYSIGQLETPSLADLRARAMAVAPSLSGRLRVTSVVDDVTRLHRDPANSGALFQVASQFNLLEMTGPDVGPEDGVTRYAYDRTQGPACAIAAGAATIYRNYFVPVDGDTGQTRDRQIDCLGDIGVALGNDLHTLWTMRNGYALCTEQGLTRIAEWLAGASLDETNALRDRLRVGLHWDVEVAGAERPPLLVSQVFCSALPVSYTGIPANRWASFASLVLEGAYEATLWAAVLNAHRSRMPVVFLTQLGGGAFGNEPEWILTAMRRALMKMTKTSEVGLDVRIVSYRAPDPGVERLVRSFESA